ncbi:hypothetical protein [uncultured Brevibacillus sp.]|uniref:hypothetical protein n=1 Tax=uncultured Brevibacillus sp. TaxID=169970 RepID=UPI002598DC33|nr:hypothetical protein [uncultured Brevibacillus sp.]
MSINLIEKEKRAISALIQDRIDEHLSHFPFARYPAEPLEPWRRTFSDPKSLPVETLRQVLRWPLGGWARNDLPSAHSRTIIAFIKLWPEFAEKAAFEPSQVFRFWQQKLTDWQNGFNAVAFLLHLMHPDAIEIVDSHRISAMRELMKTAGLPEGEHPHPLSFAALEQYSQFFRLILPKLPYGSDSRNKLDRFLKAYGNRHAYRNVAAAFRTIEPRIREFSWETASSKRFDLSKIKLRSNADVLFACLLLALEQSDQAGATLTISQITELIPLGTGGICNPASYQYAMIALFGCQKGRDYFQMNNPALKEAFTKEANNSARNMNFWKQNLDESVAINPKYQLNDGEKKARNSK